jgi:uncharacterized protein YeeX (DUF496 family)
MEQEEKKSNNAATLLLAFLLLLSAGANVFQWKNGGVAGSSTSSDSQAQIDTLLSVRIELERELASATAELEKYRGMSSSLDSLLNDANMKIGDQEKLIRELIAKEKNSTSLNAKLQVELANLRKMKEEYFDQIDALITENKELKAQNEILQESVGGLKKEKTVSILGWRSYGRNIRWFAHALQPTLGNGICGSGAQAPFYQCQYEPVQTTD